VNVNILIAPNIGPRYRNHVHLPVNQIVARLVAKPPATTLCKQRQEQEKLSPDSYRNSPSNLRQFEGLNCGYDILKYIMMSMSSNQS
jgi:hypothetical protein